MLKQALVAATNFCDEGDAAVLEDEGARMVLRGDALQVDQYVTGGLQYIGFHWGGANFSCDSATFCWEFGCMLPAACCHGSVMCMPLQLQLQQSQATWQHVVCPHVHVTAAGYGTDTLPGCHHDCHTCFKALVSLGADTAHVLTCLLLGHCQVL